MVLYREECGLCLHFCTFLILFPITVKIILQICLIYCCIEMVGFPYLLLCFVCCKKLSEYIRSAFITYSNLWVAWHCNSVAVMLSLKFFIKISQPWALSLFLWNESSLIYGTRAEGMPGRDYSGWLWRGCSCSWLVWRPSVLWAGLGWTATPIGFCRRQG